MRGKVLFWIGETDKPGSYGFIVPDGTCRRELNHWFGPKSIKGMKGYKPSSGDVVEFDAGNFKPGKGPQCARITAVLDDDDREVITTISGELDVA